MSSRPASPPPIARWPFYAGAIVLSAIAFYLLLTAGRPPAVPPLVAAMFLMGASIIACAVPHLLESERRLRLAEAAVRDAADAQVRRLAQTADQLTHVVSRGQSTEEQAGQALGTLEEVAEKMVAQAEELASALSRSGEREQSTHAEEIQRLTDERDQKLTALEIRLNATSVALSETQAAIKKSSAATSRAIETLAARLEEVADELREALAARPVASVIPPPAAPAGTRESATTDTPAQTVESEHPTIDVSSPAPTVEAPPNEGGVASKVGEPAATESSAPVAEVEADSAASSETAAVPATAASDPEAHETAPRPSRKPRNHRAVEKQAEKPADGEPAPESESVAADEPPPAAPTTPLELALEGMPEPRPVMRLNRREPPGSTSLVATAYIGIGNKLYLRGDGPGLSWERGVPMQFLAIGKWGWTTTEASVPVTCRVYRNDDTPMLEENIVIDPGAKSEITPKF